MEEVIEEKNTNENTKSTLTIQAVLWGPTKEKFEKYRRKTGKKNQDAITDCIDGFLNE